MERNRFDRKVREALEIQRYKYGPNNGGMNKDSGDYVETKVWTPYLSYLKRTDRNNFSSYIHNVTSDTTTTQ